MMKFRLFFLIFGAALLQVQGANIRMRVTPERITTDDTATLIIEVDGGAGGGAPRLELPRGLESAGASTRHSLLNGRQTTTFQYQLRPLDAGEFTIGPFRMNHHQTDHNVGPVTLTVTEAPVLSATGDLIIRMTAASERVLVQQPLELIVTLYSRHRIEDIELYEFEAPGFETGDWERFQQRDQMIDGQRYLVQRFSTRINPVSTGTRELAPVFRVWTLEPEELTRGERGIFTRRTVRRTHRMQPEAITVEVENPPAEGRPAHFANAIGRFVLDGSASPRQMNAGDPITLRVQIQGSGNLRNLLPPAMQENDDFQVFTPRLVEEDVSRDGVRGRKTIEQVIVPRHAEITEIPEISFSFFDPDLWRYETRSIGPFPVEVSPAPLRDTAAPTGLTGTLRLGTGPMILGEDLAYLQAAPGRRVRVARRNPIAFASWSALPLLTWALTGFLLRKQEHLAKNPSILLRRQAPKKLRRQLDALAAKAAEESATLHEDIWACLAAYLGDRFGIPPGEVEPDQVGGHLEASISSETLEKLKGWLETCEQARFSGNAMAMPRREAAEAFSDFMLHLDREVSA